MLVQALLASDNRRNDLPAELIQAPCRTYNDMDLQYILRKLMEQEERDQKMRREYAERSRRAVPASSAVSADPTEKKPLAGGKNDEASID